MGCVKVDAFAQGRQTCSCRHSERDLSALTFSGHKKQAAGLHCPGALAKTDWLEILVPHTGPEADGGIYMDYSLTIQWTDANNVGIPIIDDQHRGIVSVINSLGLFIRQNKGEYFQNAAFVMMDSYTKLHFATEEELLRLAGYEHFAEHRQLHENFIRKSFALSTKSIRLRDPKIYFLFLVQWWMEHINKCDHMYADTVKKYLAKQGPFLEPQDCVPVNL